MTTMERLREERERVLVEVEQSSTALDEAKVRYEAAIMRACDLEIPYTTIARRIGRTEAAVRMFVGRKRKSHA